MKILRKNFHSDRPSWQSMIWKYICYFLSVKVNYYRSKITKISGLLIAEIDDPDPMKIKLVEFYKNINWLAGWVKFKFLHLRELKPTNPIIKNAFSSLVTLHSIYIYIYDRYILYILRPFQKGNFHYGTPPLFKIQSSIKRVLLLNWWNWKKEKNQLQ